MDPIAPAPARSLSVIEAAQQAAELTKHRLFPFRFERWLALGFVAMLDQCGRGGGGGTGGSPGSPGGGDPTGGAASDGIEDAWQWIGDHMVWIVAGVALVLVLVIGLMALVAFLRSRGVFMYLDDVATGRAEIVRPWHEHKHKARSFFAWSFGASLVGLALVLVLLVPIVWLVILMVRSGASCGPIAGVALLVLAIIALAISMGLFGLLLRDFAAPLQMVLGVPCGSALRVAWGLVKAHPLTFLAYLGLKLVFGLFAGILALVAGCFTCCLGFLPVVRQTILQPVYYFERGWSLFLLRQAGYDIFPPAPPVAPPPPPFDGDPLPPAVTG
jgi:MFS family permease